MPHILQSLRQFSYESWNAVLQSELQGLIFNHLGTKTISVQRQSIFTNHAEKPADPLNT